jgi:hypothetical protein
LLVVGVAVVNLSSLPAAEIDEEEEEDEDEEEEDANTGVVVNAANVIRSAAERRRREVMNRMVFVVCCCLIKIETIPLELKRHKHPRDHFPFTYVAKSEKWSHFFFLSFCDVTKKGIFR